MQIAAKLEETIMLLLNREAVKVSKKKKMVELHSLKKVLLWKT